MKETTILIIAVMIIIAWISYYMIPKKHKDKPLLPPLKGEKKK